MCSRCEYIHPVKGKSDRSGKIFKCGDCASEHDSDRILPLGFICNPDRKSGSFLSTKGQI
ncbi:hypothetical protein [Nostoc sp. WHI]|uniref:hypothetical protein n=1 Tax=Nostoc sp. WHI TaxID=2650611 RepID=UPI0018C644E9|nr:hypothetical protein [Nostoc sp. WHI]